MPRMPETPSSEESGALALRADGLAWQDVGDQVVVLDLVASRYIEINASGAVVFRLIAQGATLSDLADALVSHFELSPDQALADARMFVSGLSEQGLLQTT